MNHSNTAMDMDSALAHRLFEDGAVLIIAGVPQKTEFGIDLCSYTIGPNFRGVKMIPPGPHYVWCASQGPYGDSGPRVGFIHYFKMNEILIREWDHGNEELRSRQIADPDLEKQRIREHLRDLDRFLAPYDYRYVSSWKNLTNDITEETVSHCRPSLGTIRTHADFQSCPDAERPRGSPSNINNYLRCHKNKIDENDLLPNLKPVEGTAPRFTELPNRVPENATPSEISQHYLDCSVAIDKVLNAFPNTNAVIAEIQIAFVFFFVGYSIESLEQWRKFLNLLAHSESSISNYKLLFLKYSELLACQLPHLPEELMEPTEHNTVYKDVRSLLINMTIGGLGVSAERLSKKLFQTMKWEFHGLLDEDPEELPVIVETE